MRIANKGILTALLVTSSVLFTGCAEKKQSGTVAKITPELQQILDQKQQTQQEPNNSAPASSQSEADKLFSTLEVEFGDGGSSREFRMRPGQSFMPGVTVRNRGTQPMGALKFALQDDEHCLTTAIPAKYELGGVNNNDMQVRHRSYLEHRRLVAKAVKDLLGSGVTVVKNLPPFGNYSQAVGMFNGWVLLDRPYIPMTGFGPLPAEDRVCVNDELVLRPDTTAGQDKHVSGYLIYQGHRHPIGTITIHVQY
jgi:hypothetical protein